MQSALVSTPYIAQDSSCTMNMGSNVLSEQSWSIWWCYWPGMHHDIKQWCRECERCQVYKHTQPTACAYMGHLLASRPNQILAIDFTILEPSKSWAENILVMTDVFLKYTQARVLINEEVRSAWSPPL